MLELRDISKKYGDFSLREISLSVQKGEYFIVLGESGSGKSILLELLAGFEIPDQGHIWLNGKDITHEKIQNRPVGLVFQDYAIFPHLTVGENIAYSMKRHKIGNTGRGSRVARPVKVIKEKVKEYALMMNISHLIDRKPGNLSGGEIQRVALARTLALEPDILLLDEPLASLDVQLKSGLRRLLRKINRNGQTIIHVTHDHREALILADKVAVMSKGRIMQYGNTEEVFNNPASEFVAHFVGIKNYFKANLQQSDGKLFVTLLDKQIQVPAKNRSYKAGLEITLFIHNEDFMIFSKADQISTDIDFKGVIEEILPVKNGYELIIDAGKQFVIREKKEVVDELKLKEGDEVMFGVNLKNIHRLG